MGMDGNKLGLDEDIVVELPGLQCYCHHHCPPGPSEGICRVGWGGRCFAAVEEVLNPGTGLLEPEYSFGCFSAGDPAFLQCKGHLVNHHIPSSILCCDGTDFCNEHLRPVYRPSNITTGPHPYSPHSADYYLLQVLLAAVLSLLVITFVVILYLVCKYRAKERLEKGRKQEEGNRLVLADSLNPSGNAFAGCKMDFGIDASSGSGSGLPLLVQRTIGGQIRLRHRIGKGRYGEVFLGEWGGTSVAVKSFLSMEDASWEREKQIYQLALMKHPNILVSMAWDIRSVESVTQMIIVTDYHSNGSLYDYLETRTLTEDEAYTLVLSAVAGLCHLHTEIEGKSYKPGIAHRDLKSKNILIKNNGEACLADFGLSVCSVQSKSEQKCVDKIPINIKSGTKRYMAPELLDDTMKYQWFESYKQADMYSFALILWEIGSRCATGFDHKEYEDYSVPFFSVTSNDPSFEEMKNLVVDHGVRPEITPRWEKSKLLSVISKVMKECWHPCPHVRLTALRVKKTLYDFGRKSEDSSPPEYFLLDVE